MAAPHPAAQGPTASPEGREEPALAPGASLSAHLDIDLAAVVRNWRALDALSAPAVETAAVVKADAYGLGAAVVGPALAAAGARRFFVALPGEGVALRTALDRAGHGAAGIWILGGFMPGDRAAFRDARLAPVLNSAAQARAWFADGPDGPAALQLDTGMNRLGVEAAELATLGPLPAGVAFVMSHLACADDPGDAMNAQQRARFVAMAGGLGRPASLAATGGILLGPDYHFALTRPGVGLYGGHPFAGAETVVRLRAPIIQIRDVAPGEKVGYGAAWTAARPSRIATLSAGYADGLLRAAGGRTVARLGERAVPYVGRLSMDLLTVDVTDSPDAAAGDLVTVLGATPDTGVDALAGAAGTIGYEILTSLGTRYQRHYRGGA
ncbi:MAG: alanine racemase [Pseudomonadota bacterium]